MWPHRTRKGQHSLDKLAESLCPEHEEKLKLFCETDQQLTCVICRDGEKHDGHKFKPIKEAAAFLRRELKKGVENLPGDILAVERLANTQREEITKTQEKARQLTNQISTQFEEMHQFLRKREDEIRNQLQEKEREDVETMSEKLNAMNVTLSERRELEMKVKSALEIPDLEKFLRNWSEGDPMMSPESLFRPRAKGLQVVYTSLSLEPYESHLQFFMWKEMLQVIKPRPELLTLKTDNTNITVSSDGRSLFSTPTSSRPHSAPFGNYSGFGTFQSVGSPLIAVIKTYDTFSLNEFTSGQHYWEMEVGLRDFWELGVQHNSLKCDGQKYFICNQGSTTELTYAGRPRKIGVYLNCSSKELSFYDADSMGHVHTMSLSHMSMPVSAYFNIGHCQDSDPNPLTVCWY
ncbi:nuclear factor 7, ovary-like [Diretmus argenteus]